MNGDAFRRRRTEQLAMEQLEEHAAEVSRCLEIAQGALGHLRRKTRQDGNILSPDAQVLYVLAQLWTRDQPGTERRLPKHEADALSRVAHLALHDADSDVETAVQALAAAAATGLLTILATRAMGS